jgi:hypothetical protein
MSCYLGEVFEVHGSRNNSKYSPQHFLTSDDATIHAHGRSVQGTSIVERGIPAIIALTVDTALVLVESSPISWTTYTRERVYEPYEPFKRQFDWFQGVPESNIERVRKELTIWFCSDTAKGSSPNLTGLYRYICQRENAGPQRSRFEGWELVVSENAGKSTKSVWPRRIDVSYADEVIRRMQLCLPNQS